jgi:sterol desaturase/sphingolipid hydroxylase (fatty acid hydroxylase superfamily)
VGLDPTIIAVAGVISTLWGIVGHTQIIDKMGPLEWIFNTPSHHRVHHGSNEKYIDKNYGNLLIIWDKMFGTFEPEIEPVKFGLVKNVDTFNPIKITFMGWRSIMTDIKNAKNLRHAMHLFFGPPITPKN